MRKSGTKKSLTKPRAKNKRHPDLVRAEKKKAQDEAKAVKVAARAAKVSKKAQKNTEKILNTENEIKTRLNSPKATLKKETFQKSAKKASQARGDLEELNSGILRELFGWFFVLGGFLGFISIVAQFARDTGPHLLGPYLGEYLSIQLVRAFGKLPVLCILVSTLVAGIKILNPAWDKLAWRRVMVGFVGTLLISLILSIPFQTMQEPILYDFENTGGYVGSLLVHFILQPIFRDSIIGSYLALSFLFFMSLIWGLSWRPSEWIGQVLSKTVEIAETARLRARERAEERLLEHSPAEQLIRRKKQKELIDRRSEKEEVEKTDDLPSTSAGEEIQGIPASEVDDVVPQGDTEFQKIEERALDAVQLLNSMSEAERNSMDQRELRKLIEDAKQINIARQLNQWEFSEKEKVKIQGIISNQERADALEVSVEEMPAATSNTARDIDATLAIKVVPQQKRQTLDVLNQEISKTFEKIADRGVEMKPPVDNHSLENLDKQPEPQLITVPPIVEYQVPDIVSLLPEPPEQKLDLNPEDLQLLSSQLEAKLSTFKVQGKVVAITTGPVITRFEIDLAPGVKVAKISGLERDLALALKARSIRILAPIPGKAAVGIEVPNLNPQIVYGKSILLASAQEDDPDKITIALGKDIAGDAYTMDLAKAPHLLIAGQTGSGKSVCINTLMASILSSKKPDELKMILVDPKVVELKPYEDIPHLIHPVITDPELAVAALKWACWEMDRRYDVLAKIRTRNIAGFNAKIAKGGLEEKLDPDENKKMPFMVIMIDELADLMMVAGKEVEVSIARIAQKARAVGIHLVLATQRPSTNVITGTIKANLPTRICFKVASHIDARTVMDKAGGEKLLGRGDMLFRSISDPEPVRVHGAFLTDDEVEVVTDACSEQNVIKDQLKGFDLDGGGEGLDEDELGPRDDLFQDAAELAVHTGKASASMLQRRLQIGYARAGRLIDQLENAGIVGPGRGAKPRTILMDETELKSFLSGDVDRIILED